MSTCEPCREIKIKMLPYHAYDAIRNISKRIGITKTKFVATRLGELIRTIPDNKKTGHNELAGYMRVYGVGSRTKQEWQALADYYGVDVSAVIKIKLIDDIDAMPAHEKVAIIE